MYFHCFSLITRGHRSVYSLFWRNNRSEIGSRFNMEPGKSTLPLKRFHLSSKLWKWCFYQHSLIALKKLYRISPILSGPKRKKYIHHHLTSKSFPFLWRLMVFWRRRVLDRCHEPRTSIFIDFDTEVGFEKSKIGANVPRFDLKKSRWWQLKHFLFSPRKLGKIPILMSIFFNWVGSTTN